MIGDWTPSYLPSICVASTIRAFYPGVKLIVMLRHPIHRAYSRFKEMDYFARDQLKRNVSGVKPETLTVNNIPVYLGWEKFVAMAIGDNSKCMQQHAAAW